MSNVFRVLNVRHITENLFILRSEKPNVEIRAGQCFNVGIPGVGINREYSMCSSPNDSHLDFYIRAVPDGRLSQRLQKMQAGNEIEIDGPDGEFCIDNISLDKKFTFIATGTGIAPFLSFIRTYPDINCEIIHGVRYPFEIFPDLSHLLNYKKCISVNDFGSDQNMRVTDYLNQFPRATHETIYLCGNRKMIIDTVELLLDQGVNGDKIISEVFF